MNEYDEVVELHCRTVTTEPWQVKLLVVKGSIEVLVQCPECGRTTRLSRCEIETVTIQKHRLSMLADMRLTCETCHKESWFDLELTPARRH